MVNKKEKVQKILREAQDDLDRTAAGMAVDISDIPKERIENLSSDEEVQTETSRGPKGTIGNVTADSSDVGKDAETLEEKEAPGVYRKTL